ncbi:photoreceptor outer segment membrane glycoprotein 2 [Gadus morhua]|uniref:Photoreceptor outer segment membrane glycoprotein 2-like n=1 Tax=Gadus morhua TaxID=8049 RepID=A0A8C5AE10_GADMO|nr:photoreceptor outer segment membrane glycoprotein 2-like [Gadus morhua]
MAVGKVTFTREERDQLAKVLWMLNWISVVTGVIIFSLGLFIKVEIQKQRDVMSDQDILYVPHMLIATGLVACCINFLGGKICYDCVDGAKFTRWKLVMLPYIVCTFCFTFCVLVGALLCYSMRSQLEDSLQLGLRGAMRYYKDTDTPGRCYLKRTLDLLQIQFECCGNAGYKDWFAVQWVSNRYLDMTSPRVLDRLRSNVEGKYLMDGVPFSCCNTFSPRPCIQHQLTNNSAHFSYRHQTDRLNLWTRGCRQVLLEHYTGILQSTGLIVLLIWLFELLVLTGVRYLQTAMENLLLLGDLDSESDGWILENSLAETARWNLNVIKNLGKCYNVDDDEDPNINVPRSQESQGEPTTSEVTLRRKDQTRHLPL